MPRHILTTEEKQLGFRNAVLKVQTDYNVDFNEAVQWLLRKISPRGNWIEARKQRKRIHDQCFKQEGN